MGIAEGITTSSVEQVHFFYPSGNDKLKLRNERIAKKCAIQLKSSKRFSSTPVFLYLLDTNSLEMESVQVSYEKYEGEFQYEFDRIFKNEKPHVCITVAAIDSHEERTLFALNYAMENLPYLKRLRKKLAKKKKNNSLMDEDIDKFIVNI